MNMQQVRQGLEENDISVEETIVMLKHSFSKDYLCRHIVIQWSIISDQMKQLDAYKLHADPPRLETATIARLIDELYLSGGLSIHVAKHYHQRNGMLEAVAQAHVTKLAEIKDKGRRRNDHVEHPYSAQRYCTYCGRKTPAKALSTRGICFDCNLSAQAANIEQLQTRQGAYYNTWLENTIASLAIQAHDLVYGPPGNAETPGKITPPPETLPFDDPPEETTELAGTPIDDILCTLGDMVEETKDPDGPTYPNCKDVCAVCPNTKCDQRNVNACPHEGACPVCDRDPSTCGYIPF